jgi:hypothetical protein
MTKPNIAPHWIDREWIDSAQHRDSIDDFIEYKRITLSVGSAPSRQFAERLTENEGAFA